MTFNADILRQQIQQTRINTMTQGLETLTGHDQAGVAQVAEQGNAMGFRLQKEADPTAKLMDSMEELSFQFEETEMKSVSERALGESKRKDTSFLRAVEFWTEKMPDMPNSEFMAKLMRQARHGAFQNAQDLLRGLGGGSSDVSHQFAMLECLEEALSENPADEKLLALVKETKAELEHAKGPEIRVGINLAEEINSRAGNMEEMQGMRDLYRGQILGFTTPQDCFKSLIEQRGAGRLAESIEFLLAGCSVDLQSTNPSTSPEELRRIILDLQCVEVLKTVNEKLGRLGLRMERQFNETVLLSAEKMTGRVLDMTKLSFMNSATVGGFVNACGLRELLAQMDFVRELLGLFRGLSPRLFETNEGRFKMVDSAQEYLDELVEKEEEEKEKKREKDSDR